MALTWNETQAVTFRNWTRLVEPTSYDDNRYTKHGVINIYMPLWEFFFPLRIQVDVKFGFCGKSNLINEHQKTAPKIIQKQNKNKQKKASDLNDFFKNKSGKYDGLI